MIKDSGDRTEFESGAVRDMRKGKGRCDLLPLDVVDESLTYPENSIFPHISKFQETGDSGHLRDILRFHWDILRFESPAHMLLEVAKHFEEGAKKYGDNNWRKGIPANVYIDSAIRHYLKFLRGDTDERHDRAFMWNIMCCIWTCEHIPELNTYAKNDEKENGNDN